MTIQSPSIPIHSPNGASFKKEASSAYFGRAFAQEKGTVKTWLLGVQGNKGKSIFSSSPKPDVQKGVPTSVLAGVGGLALLALAAFATKHFKAPAKNQAGISGKMPASLTAPVKPGLAKLDLATAFAQLQTAPTVSPEALKVVTDEINALHQAGKTGTPEYKKYVNAIKDHGDSNSVGQALSMLEDKVSQPLISDLLGTTHRQKAIEYTHRNVQKAGFPYAPLVIEAINSSTSTNDIKNIFAGIKFNQPDTAAERDAILNHAWTNANHDIPVAALDSLVSDTSNAPSSPLPLLTEALTALPPTLHDEVAKRITQLNDSDKENLFKTLLDHDDPFVAAEALKHLNPTTSDTDPLWKAATEKKDTGKNSAMVEAALALKDATKETEDLKKEAEKIQNSNSYDWRKRWNMNSLITDKLNNKGTLEKAAAINNIEFLPEDQRLDALAIAFTRANQPQEYDVRLKILDKFQALLSAQPQPADPESILFTDKTFAAVLKNALGDPSPQVRHHALRTVLNFYPEAAAQRIARSIAGKDTNYSVKSAANYYLSA